MNIKSIGTSVTSNIIGAVVGGVAGYFAAKKLMKMEHKIAVYGTALVGAVLGAMAQSKMKSKAMLASTAATVKA